MIWYNVKKYQKRKEIANELKQNRKYRSNNSNK